MSTASTWNKYAHALIVFNCFFWVLNAVYISTATASKPLLLVILIIIFRHIFFTHFDFLFRRNQKKNEITEGKSIYSSTYTAILHQILMIKMCYFLMFFIFIIFIRVYVLWADNFFFGFHNIQRMSENRIFQIAFIFSSVADFIIIVGCVFRLPWRHCVHFQVFRFSLHKCLIALSQRFQF